MCSEEGEREAPAVTGCLKRALRISVPPRAEAAPLLWEAWTKGHLSPFKTPHVSFADQAIRPLAVSGAPGAPSLVVFPVYFGFIYDMATSLDGGGFSIFTFFCHLQ